MEKDRITYLYQCYLDKSYTETDLEEFKAALLDIDLDELCKEVLDDELAELDLTVLSDVSTARSQEMFETITMSRPVGIVSIPFWKRIWIAASILIAVSLGYYFYPIDLPKTQTENAHANDVQPGKKAATLLLSTGKIILLDDSQSGELATEAGIVITKSAGGGLIYKLNGSSNANNQKNTLSTSNGETYQVRLPDGSLVWLNSSSSLSYSPTLLINGKRLVKLTGEGFFEVAKDALHPFVVEAGNQKVEVLGTHFDVNSYQDEPVIATTLLEGAVKVSSEGRSKLISPGQQVLNSNHSLSIKDVNVEQVIDWKEGDFNLTGVDFRIAMRKIARWYNVELIYKGPIPENIQTDGWISRNQKLSSVLDMIEKLGIVHFQIDGKKVYVSGRYAPRTIEKIY